MDTRGNHARPSRRISTECQPRVLGRNGFFAAGSQALNFPPHTLHPNCLPAGPVRSIGEEPAAAEVLRHGLSGRLVVGRQALRRQGLYPSLSLSLYIYICMRVYVYIHMYVHISISISLSIYIYLYVYTYVCLCAASATARSRPTPRGRPPSSTLTRSTSIYIHKHI